MVYNNLDEIIGAKKVLTAISDEILRRQPVDFNFLLDIRKQIEADEDTITKDYADHYNSEQAGEK
jgi:hypothetical protein